MTDHENKNTQHRPSTGETPQSHENGLITTLWGLGVKSLERTKQTLHKSDTQDDAPSLKTHIYYDGELIETQTFPQLYARMLRQKPETNQQSTIVSPED